MNTHYTYLLIDALTILFPFLLSFDKKVAFYKTWRYLWRGMLLTGAFFIVWDIAFTHSGVWAFNSKYVMGMYIGGLPVEEWLFFIVVPYSCAFIYDCLLAYMPIGSRKDNGWRFLLPLGGLLIFISLSSRSLPYTFSALGFCGIFILLLYVFRSYFGGFRADAFLCMFLISIIPFLLVNGALTALPVVIYNNSKNLNLRIYTIPVEDIFYGMLLMLGNIVSLPPRRYS